VKRIQFYLDEDVWTALLARSRQQGITICELVRRAVRERYFGSLDARRKAMLAIIGIRKDRSEIGDSKSHIRSLRRGTRSLR
jgi:hypothetical protein